MHKYSDQFIRSIPKSDLHLHLDGSLRLSTLIDIAKSESIKLPSYTEDGLRQLVFKESYQSLDEYLKGFGLTCSVMQQREFLERVAYELAWDNWNEGVRYIEVRFAPQLHMSDQLSFEDVMIAVDKGLKRARAEINAKLAGGEPGFEFGIIVCAMRFCNEHFSKFYRSFFALHKYSSQLETIRLASLELAKAAVALKGSSDIQIVGFDLAGSEYGYPADDHEESYDYVHKHFLHKSVHAGEAYGPESIFQAITKLHADRIGHGLYLFESDMVLSKDIADKKKYVRDLASYIADARITIEVCLTSNLQTAPKLKAIGDHSLRQMLDNKLSLTFCTDNRLVSDTTVSDEIRLAVENFDIAPGVLKDIIIYGFKRSFFYHPYPKRRNYVRRIIDYYEKIEAQHGIAPQEPE
jgi:adenosine deaminase